MKNKLALSSLALDLKRMALAYHRGSEKVAARFFEEALKRKQEVDVSKIKPYVVDLLDKFEKIKFEKERDKRAEDALMYSTLFQNAALVK
ncbi:MAG: hypothetical protein AAB662_03715 [Patescibacteria group bacterium]